VRTSAAGVPATRLPDWRVPTFDGVADVPQAVATALQDRYMLERELGRGGTATVYLAHDLRHERSHEPARPTSQKPGGGDISLTPEFIIFGTGGLPPAFSGGISSRPSNQVLAPPTGRFS
jgi:hypothetical protein